MKPRLLFTGLLFVALFFVANQDANAQTQAEINQKIQEYTTIVNQAQNALRNTYLSSAQRAQYQQLLNSAMQALNYFRSLSPSRTNPPPQSNNNSSTSQSIAQQRQGLARNNLSIALRWLGSLRNLSRVNIYIQYSLPPIYQGQFSGGTAYRIIPGSQAASYITNLTNAGNVLTSIKVY